MPALLLVCSLTIGLAFEDIIEFGLDGCYDAFHCVIALAQQFYLLLDPVPLFPVHQVQLSVNFLPAIFVSSIFGAGYKRPRGARFQIFFFY